MSIVIRKGCVPGCVGRVTELHAVHYSKLVGFGMPFESRVARELGEFCERYDDGRDGLWLAIEGGVVQGSIAIDGLHAKDEGAHLRWFITADEVRGTGIGNSLLACAVDFLPGTSLRARVSLDHRRARCREASVREVRIPARAAAAGDAVGSGSQ